MIAILSQDKRYLCMYGVEEATMVRCESKFVDIRTGSKDAMEQTVNKTEYREYMQEGCKMQPSYFSAEKGIG